MSCQILKLSHVQAILKFTPDYVGAGGTWTIGLGTTGYSGQVVGSGNTVGIALFGAGNTETISTPKVHVRHCKWSGGGSTTAGIRVTRNNKDVLQLFTSGELDTHSLSENETSDIVVTIDGSGTLILDLAKRDGFEPWQSQLFLQNSGTGRP